MFVVAVFLGWREGHATSCAKGSATHIQQSRAMLCKCRNPATVGLNGYTCDDGRRGFCSADQVCGAVRPFTLGTDWRQICHTAPERNESGDRAWRHWRRTFNASARHVILGNAPLGGPLAIEQSGSAEVHDLYFFNQCPHAEQVGLARPPRRVWHLWNQLFTAKVLRRHETLARRFHGAYLLSTRHWQGVGVSQMPLSVATQRCFTDRPNDGSPWSLGFFVLSRLVTMGARPQCAGFAHKSWSGHPMACERRAFHEWRNTGRLTVL